MAKQKASKRAIREAFQGYAFLTPALVTIGVFILLPILYAIYLSFQKVNLLAGFSEFVGFNNYARITDDYRAGIALRNTAFYVAIVVPTQTILALILAACLNAKIKGTNFFRVVFFLPTLTSSAVLALIFMFMYNNQNGLVNQVLASLGLPTYNWLGDPSVALLAIMIMNIWATAPFYMVIYLAALKDIPASLYEAADLDGASTIQKFRYITVPMLRPITSFVVIMGIIGTFQLFDQSYIFSGGSGGPDNSTLTIVLLIYQYAFQSYDQMGYAAALAFLLAVIILIATLIQRKFQKNEQVY
ncbi:sugar ABC transporter permease [Halalkalibacterium halodurans]|jgi:multiple sugar transport system permease protein/raffinose/stachyose/melibiose transport system permease protein|uniref:Sugar transport system (Permease) n=1 Tax=Halalkalibacterium halodurans (strain ATCC BAA-125 / DSM 18197 / FERM 7344 / JCM 9153 / C-125) TaxID=272558 RepID=Q9K6N9_HALH5|nr:sugar ABC transporter permease [Halalkalibacterium halodurans]MED3646409.1 sugar ABC transporter permease [Halalkalibacterium halodurans]MED4082003.1 sugar ABC transporter permease [Halalkalibacterium halodurans]MED4083615.1 sugar ABC transporter permease [Halalkalibacterium halodurans]MED4106631.1 sugar ABC transporter permease [Halalkalibacterium halodurans]MED4107893.1 sugar ABC transporter permease [Halalkalibacterium halodurans]